jgi:hypothetical protein
VAPDRPAADRIVRSAESFEALTSTALDASTGACLDSADIEEETGDERDEYPSESIQRSGGRCEPERRRRGNGPGSLRTEHGAA